MRLFFVVLFTVFLVLPISAQDDEDRQYIINNVFSQTEPNIIQNLLSPDEQFSVQVDARDCVVVEEMGSYAYETLTLIDTQSGVTQLITDQLISCGGLGAFGLWALHWSNDGSQLYFTDAREGVPDGLVSAWSPPISRVNIETLEVERLGQAQFSPERQWIAFQDGTGITISSIDASVTEAFPLLLSDMMITQMIWLPDSSAVMIIYADMPYASTESAVVLIDISTFEQTVLYSTTD